MNRRTLLRTTSLTAIAFCGGLAVLDLPLMPPAYAACSPSTPTNGDTVTCTGTTNGPIGSGNLNSTNFTIVSGATFDDSQGGAKFGSNNIVTVNGTIIDDGAGANGVVLYGSGNTVTINGRTASSTYFIPIASYGDISNMITVGTGGTVETTTTSQEQTNYPYAAAINYVSGGQTPSATSRITITNYGIIRDNANFNAISALDGNWFTGTTAGPTSIPMTVINGGVINGSVLFGSNGSNMFQLLPGGSITNGIIDATRGSNDTLSLGGSGTGTFDVGTIGPGRTYQGFEFFEKDGDSTWTLTGTNPGAGPSTVAAGSLIWNATTPNVPVSVLVGATLSGTGTLGSLDNQGTVAPGDAIGTLTLTGNYTQHSNGTLQVEISPTAASKLAVGGTASLAGTLAVLPDAGTYTVGTKYQILTAQSVTGTHLHGTDGQQSQPPRQPLGGGGVSR
jgi:hypothetical protein